ncbi:MAG: BamA/TamA family outer membrane protein [Syntrophobacterales bacterium]|nr:BamA/TamA family outer membrane protein [Syntrophobacterales bacterium]
MALPEPGGTPRRDKPAPHLRPAPWLVWLWLWLGVGVALPLTAGAAVAPAPPLTLVALEIQGARIIPAAQVREQLSLDLPSRWPWKKPPPFRPEDLENDLERLKIFYRRQGFYHARVTSRLQVDEKGRVRAILQVEEGPFVRVNQIKVEVREPGADLDYAQLAREHPVKPGERFTERGYDELRAQYVTALQDHGHPRGQVKGRVYLDELENRADIHLTVDPGPRCVFGEVQLKKDAPVPDYLILRKLTFRPGEAFSFRKLYESQRQLYETDLFKSVTLTPAEVPEAATVIPVVVEVQRGKRGTVKVGLGYGDVDLFRARLALRLRNLGGGGRLMDLEGKYSIRESRVTGTFTNPQFLASRWDAVVQGGWVEWDLPGFQDRAFFTQARLERDLPWRLRVYVGHGLEFARPFGIPNETLFILREARQDQLFTASMLLFGLRRDTTDRSLDPEYGHILSLTQELALDFLGGNLQFSRTVAEARGYYPLGRPGWVLAGRLKFGVIEPLQGTGEIPLFRRFFAGGAGSVRGYRFNYLGPRNEAGTPIGGEAILEGNAELRVPLYKEFTGVVFFDFGNVYFRTQEVDPGQLKYAAGGGVRYRTPIGPVGLDVGFPLNRQDPRQDPAFRLLLTIGQQF